MSKILINSLAQNSSTLKVQLELRDYQQDLAKKLGYQPGWAYYRHLELRALAGGEK